MSQSTSRPPSKQKTWLLAFLTPVGLSCGVMLVAAVIVLNQELEEVDRPSLPLYSQSSAETLREQPTEQQAEGERVRRSVSTASIASPEDSPIRPSAPVFASSGKYDEQDEQDDQSAAEEDEAMESSEQIPDERTPEEIAAAKARARERYLGGSGPFSKALNLSVAGYRERAAEEAGADLKEEPGASGDVRVEGARQGDVLQPENNLAGLGGAVGQN